MDKETYKKLMDLPEGNTMASVVEVKLPAGTKINTGYSNGNGFQIEVPQDENSGFKRIFDRLARERKY